MWKEILRKRRIHAVNHPVFFWIKVLTVIGMLTLGKVALWIAQVAIDLTIGVNLIPTKEDYLLPLSDREHRIWKVEECLLYSLFYAGILLISDLWQIVVVRDAFYREHALYILLLVLFTAGSGMAIGLDMGLPKKKEKTGLGKVVRMICGLVWIIILIQTYDFLLLNGMLSQRFHLFFCTESWLLPTLCAGFLVVIYEGIRKYRRLGVFELQETGSWNRR